MFVLLQFHETLGIFQAPHFSFQSPRDRKLISPRKGDWWHYVAICVIMYVWCFISCYISFLVVEILFNAWHSVATREHNDFYYQPVVKSSFSYIKITKCFLCIISPKWLVSGICQVVYNIEHLSAIVFDIL